MKKISYLAIIGSLSLALIYWFCPRPELDMFSTYSTAWYDSDGQLLRLSLAADDRYRLYTKIDDVSANLISATILYEDQHFYDHNGVDVPALLRALYSSYIVRTRKVGASTITMQLARLRWGIKSNTISGKVQQIIRALQLSRHYSKAQILQSYLNNAPYGRNIEGIGAASLIYFNKKPADLSLPEALTLAVIPQNPNKRSPSNPQGYNKLLPARAALFERYIQQHPEARQQQLFMQMPLAVRVPEQLPRLAPHFINYLSSELPSWQHGDVNTTLDSRQQMLLQALLGNYVHSRGDQGIHNASALLLNHQTMQIKAMVGSADFYNDAIHGQVNGVTAKRSPGSTLKPFVYALAIDEGLIHPLTLLKDAPRRFGGFSPENYDQRFIGPIVAKQALVQSRNVPAVWLQSQLSTTSFYDFLQQAEINALKEQAHYGLALALGGGEVTMLELSRLYAMLANGGVLHPIKSIANTRSSARQIHNDNRPTATKRLLSKEASFLILDMLKDNPPPHQLGISTAGAPRNDIAWKTGTSWAFRDAWAVAVSGSYVLAVWVGNFNGEGNHAFVGRTAAGPLLFSMLNAINTDSGWQITQLPKLRGLNLKQVDVCKKTGDLAIKYCPSTEKTWFIPGVSPIKPSTIYRAIPIDKESGLRACQYNRQTTEMRIFEFWPSDLLHIFNQAGVALKTPPTYLTNCPVEQKSHSGVVPRITSPQQSVQYVIQSHQPSNPIAFSAVVDPDVKKLYWFVDHQYVGSVPRGEPLMWNGVAGDQQVRVVDDAGRSSSSNISVVYAQ